MKATVKNLLDFVNSGASLSADLTAATSEIGELRLRLVAIKILSWLKLQKKFGKVRPLDLDDRHEWCRDLLHLVESRDFLDDVVTVSEGAVVLSPDLPVDEREKLWALVDSEYQPRLMKRAPSGNDPSRATALAPSPVPNVTHELC